MKQRLDRALWRRRHAEGVVTFLNSHINKVINKPEVREAWLKQGPFPLFKTPRNSMPIFGKDIEKWANVVKSLGERRSNSASANRQLNGHQCQRSTARLWTGCFRRR